MENELPEGWELAPFASMLDTEGGTQPPKSNFLYEQQEGYVRLLQIRDFGDKPVPTFIPYEKGLKTCNKGDILIARYGASIGRIVTGQEGAYNVALTKVVIPDALERKYIFWFLKSQYFQSVITSFQRTAQNGFNKSDLADIEIPLPPLAEQKRIVAKLDTAFAHLKTLKASLARIPELLKKFRQTVLTQAVTGKLTEEWREENYFENQYDGIPMDIMREIKFSLPINWCWKPFDSIAKVESNLVEPLQYLDYPLIAPDNIESETGRLIDKPLVVQILPKSPKHLFDKGVIIYSKIRPYLSKLIIAEFAGLCSADMYPITTSLEVRYLYIYMLSTTFLRYANTAGERSVLPKINQKGLGVIPVAVPPLEEQQEIVQRVEALFAQADALEAQYVVLKAKIDKLPQALLIKAFRGELVPQDPTDEPASVLLKKIKAATASVGKKTGRQTRLAFTEE